MANWKRIYTSAFFALCALPALLMPFSRQDTEFEKRTASAFPQLRDADGGLNHRFGAQTETWLSEHFAFRAELVTANNLLQSTLFGVSAQDSVVTGKDGWLYLAETMDDYTGTNACSARELHNLVYTLELMQNYAAAQQTQFLLMIPPNKATLYDAQLPGWYRRGTQSNLSRLTAALADSAVPYLDLTAALGESEEILYHKRDSHWTNAGARLAYDRLLTALDLPHASYVDAPFQMTRDWRGDLDDLGFPTLGVLDTQITYELPLTDAYSYTSRVRSVEAADITTVAPAASGSLLMFRDSFGNALLPFVSSAVGTVRYQKYVPYQLDLLADGGYDAVVIEVVERNLMQLLETSPRCPAQSVALTESVGVLGTSDTTLSVRRDGNYLRVSGTADAAYVGMEQNIYLLQQSAAGSVLYAAYPCGAYGFCAYLPADSVPQDATFAPLLQTDTGALLLTPKIESTQGES